MSFGQSMAHIAVINQNARAYASGMTRPILSVKVAEWSKATDKVREGNQTIGIRVLG